MTVLLSTKLRKKLLAYSFTHSDENYYVRELASYIHEDPGNLSRELRKLEGEGLYKSVSRGKVKFYSLDKSYPLFSELKAIIFKTEGVFGTLKESVSGYEGITLAFIYGSYAKDQEKASSDIDMVVVGDFDRDAFTEELRKLEARLSREINFNAYTKEEFHAERKKHGGFLNLVLKEKILLLKGKL
jgi:predicted nucleotidyltransferase